MYTRYEVMVRIWKVFLVRSFSSKIVCAGIGWRYLTALHSALVVQMGDDARREEGEQSDRHLPKTLHIVENCFPGAAQGDLQFQPTGCMTRWRFGIETKPTHNSDNSDISPLFFR